MEINKIPAHELSKSTFMKGCQCIKALYLNKHCKNLRDEVSAAQEAIFSRGTAVGELAQELFPGGIDASPRNYYKFQESVAKTAEYIANGKKVIYEAAFQFEGVLVALDILVKKEGHWHAYEVKSSTSVSATYELDASLQYFVISNSGLSLDSISILHLNNQYVRQGNLNIEELFTVTDITEAVLNLQETVQTKIPELKKVLKLKDIPNIQIGKHCNTPYNCDFQGHCWDHLPKKYSVFKLTNARGKDWELYNKGIYSLENVPNNYPLTKNQQMQVNGYKTGKIHIDKKGIKDFLSNIKHPMYFLDFETIIPAVPMWDASKPYQQITFQYSLHYQDQKGGNLKHCEFLAETKNKKDPRIAMIEQLIKETEMPGDIWVYNIAFERARLKEIARDLPKYNNAALAIANRLRDLIVPFQKKLYYTPNMDGRYTIKKVLPALVPELCYDDLVIQEGGTASTTFEEMISGRFDGDEVVTRKHLLEYCKLDTLAMVKILEKLFALK